MGKRNRKRRHLSAVPGPGSGHARPAEALRPPTPNRDVDAVIGAIAAGVLDDALQRLGKVISERLAALRHARSVELMATLDVGDRVRINRSVRPLYLHGAVGTIAGFAGGRVVVTLDYPVGRFVTGEVRCPPGAVELLHEDA